MTKNTKKVGFAVLAAGEGTRLKLNYSKPMAPLCGLRLIDYPVQESIKFINQNGFDGFIGMITGHKRDELEGYLNEEYTNENIKYCVQKKQLGTADALRTYFTGIEDAKKTDYTIVLCADTPLIRISHMEKLLKELEDNKLDGVCAVFNQENPTGYGRIICGDPGFHIVEEKEASDEQKQVKTVNSGFYILKTSYIDKYLFEIGSDNKSGEFYLTDLFQDDRKVKAVLFENADAFLGVNTQKQLSDANYQIRREVNLAHQENGVHIIDFRHTYIDKGVEIGSGSVIHPNTFLYRGTVLGKDCEVEPGSIIKNSTIEDGVVVKANCYFEDAIIRKNAVVGPFARIRPGSDIGEDSKIGNFVETKKVKLHKGVKVSHLSYVGDAEIGDNTNIGCGFITCNYDGANKHKTTIGKDSFIGSDCQMIAPLRIGNRAYVGSGSTINKDIPDDAFAIARARQENKEGMARKFIKTKK